MFFEEEAAKQPLTELLAFIGHEDDSLAMATLNLAMNMAKMNFFKDPSIFLSNPLDRSKLIWHLKKALHSQQSQRCPNRLKGLLQTLAHAVPMLCADDQLMAFACEQALLATHCDYFLVKVGKSSLYNFTINECLQGGKSRVSVPDSVGPCLCVHS